MYIIIHYLFKFLYAFSCPAHPFGEKGKGKRGGNAENLIKSLDLLFTRNKVKNYSMCINRDNSLDPNWVTGFTDAEGCFSVIISKRSNLNWRVQVSFEINLHIKDIAILYLIKILFGVGSVSSRKKKIYLCLSSN